ncbi:MAG: hypothetical protein WBP45_11560 [Daejeonella sp.]
MAKYKFTLVDNNNNPVYHNYGNVYTLQKTTANNRLQIGATNNQIDLILKLVDNLNPPYFILYILLISRLDNQPGRYESPQIETKEDLKVFLEQYKEFLKQMEDIIFGWEPMTIRDY